MRSKRSALVVLFLGGALSAIACSDDDDDASSGGKGGKAGSTAAGKAGGSGKAGAAGSAGSASAGTSGSGGTGIAGAGGVGTSGTNGVAGSSGGSVAGTTGDGAGGTGGVTTEGGAAGVVEGGGEAGTVGEGGTAGAPVGPSRHLYVGCSDTGAGTLQIYRVDDEGVFTVLPPTDTDGNISNATFNAAETRLHVAHQIGTTIEARVTTYSRNRSTGALTVLGTPANVPFSPPGGVGGAGAGGGGAGGGGAGGGGAGGAAPSQAGPQTITLDADENFLAVPNYLAGNVYVYNVNGNGSVGSLVSAQGNGTNAHHAVFSNNGDYLLVPYLGSNLIRVYNYNDVSGAITFDSDRAMPATQTGPRHLALHSNGTWLYSINETAGGTSTTTGSIDFFTFNQANGDLTPVSTIHVPLPTGYTNTSVKNGSEIEIAPGGHSLYVSLRLDGAAQGSLVVFSIESNGTLTFVEQQSSRGFTPRQFSLSKDGTRLIVGNQNSDTIELFSVNTTTGRLTFLSERVVCDSPRFARFAEIQ